MNRFFAFLLLCVASQQSFLYAGSDADWADVFGYSGLSGAAHAMVVSGSDLYVGGTFEKAGNKIANYIARWDGTEWLALGVGFKSTVYAVAIDSVGNVWAGGSFTLYGDNSSVNHIAYWNGSSWNPVGGGVDGTVSAIAVDPSGNIYVGGSFTTVGGGTPANNIAMWNGAWNALGSGTVGTNGQVNALAVDNSGNIYVGGNFTTAGGGSANRIAQWNGSAWSSLGSGLDNVVNAITTDGTNVYAGGQFTQAGGTAAARIAVWNTSAWSDIDGGVGSEGGDKVKAVWYQNGILYVGGEFSNVGGGAVTISNIACWSDADSWQEMGDGMDSIVNAITKNVYVGGAFVEADGQSAYRVAQWSGVVWSALSNANHNGLNGTVFSIAAESGNSVYAGGSFTLAGATTVSNIAKWNGLSWSDVAQGVNGQVEALAVSGSTLYAGGSFSSAGGGATAVSNLAKYVSGSWSDVGSGTNGTVYTLAVDGSGNLYVGGEFTQVGGSTSASNIAMYSSGGAWSAVEDGFDSVVRTIVIDGSDIYAGGDFTYSGATQVNYIAKYSGGSWLAMDDGTNGSVMAMDASSGSLYIGGLFSEVGSVPLPTIAVAKWNLSGATWSGLGATGMDNAVYAVAASGVNVYFGGEFTTADGSSANRVAKWTGSAWDTLGSGVSDELGSVYALEIGSLYVGGDFEVAGNKACYNFGKYSDAPTSSVTLELSLILEGPYDSSGDEMSAALNPYIPTTSPYNSSVTGSAPADAVDWVHVLLRTAVDGVNVDSASAFLFKDGTVTEPGQTAGQVNLAVSEGNYYILVEHRNHLDMISANAVYLSGTSASTYDFTTAASQAYSDGQKLLGSKYGMYAGDGNADGEIQNDDKNAIWWPDVGKGGYYAGDFNLDSQVQNDDKNDYWWPNVGRGSAVP